MLKKCSMAVALVMALSWAGTAQDARSVVAEATKAAGADTVKTIQYSGPGSEYSFGQAHTPGGAWPLWKNKTYTRTIDFDAKALKIDRVAEPTDPQRRGGGLAPAATQTIIVAANTAPAQQIGLLLSPYNFLKSAAAGNATVSSKTIDGKKFTVVTYAGANKAPVNGYIDSENMVAHVETWIDNPVLGDTRIDAHYSDFKDFGGVKVPMKIVESQGGFPTLEISVADVKVNQPANIQPPQGRGGAPGGGGGGAQPAATSSRKLAEGVFLILPAYASLAIDFKDGIVLIEGGNSEARANAIIEEAKKLIPNKPIKYVVNTHSHFDHSSGLRAFVAQGIPIMTHQASKAYLQKVLAQPRTLSADAQPQPMKKVSVEGVGTKKVLTDGNHVVELHHVAGSLHHAGELIAYLPKQKILVQADGFLPPATVDATTPNQLNPNKLLSTINSLKLAVDAIVAVHYPADQRVVTMEELTKRAAMQPAPAGSR